MNFLSHYYFEHCPDSPYLTAGLAIPDLVKHFSKTYNRVLKNAAVPPSVLHSEMHKGILQHYEADKKFHADTDFVEHSKFLIALFLNEGLNRQKIRLSVLAHIAIELMLDGCIVRYDKTIANKYYQTLQATNEGVLATYFDEFCLPIEKQQFLSSFQLFMQRKFVLLLDKSENIVLGLEKIYGPVAGIQFTEIEKQQIVAAIHNMESQLRYSWQQLLKK